MNPFLDNTMYTNNDELSDKLTNAGYEWESYEHNEENFDFILMTNELDSLRNYYALYRKNSDIFDEEELSDIILSWVISENS